MWRAAAALVAVSSADALSSSLQAEVAAAAAQSEELAQVAGHALEAALLQAAEQKEVLRRPTFPARWWANATVTTVTGGKVVDGEGSGSTLIAQELDNKRRAMLQPHRFAVAPAEWQGTPLEFFNVTNYFTNGLIGFAINDNKLVISTAPVPLVEDTFSFMRLAFSCGQVELKGRSLACWHLNLAAVKFQLLVDEAGAPVQYQMNVTAGKVNRDTIYDFVEYHGNATLPWLWDNFNKDDFVHPKLCEAAPPVNMTMYIFHPANNFEIAGQDLADLVGDTVFVCSDVLTNQTMAGDHNYAWLTQWELEVNPTWGQYQNCNGYPPMCLSAEKTHVGHEAAYYLGKTPSLSRQCGTNPLVGEWYSLPPAGKCQGTATPADGSCSWRIIRKVKTIDGQCLFNKGAFRQSCVTEGRAPFLKTRELFRHAFESIDPQDGGCPAIDAAEAKNVELVV